MKKLWEKVIELLCRMEEKWDAYQEWRYRIGKLNGTQRWELFKRWIIPKWIMFRDWYYEKCQNGFHRYASFVTLATYFHSERAAKRRKERWEWANSGTYLQRAVKRELLRIRHRLVKDAKYVLKHIVFTLPTFSIFSVTVFFHILTWSGMSAPCAKLLIVGLVIVGLFKRYKDSKKGRTPPKRRK